MEQRVLARAARRECRVEKSRFIACGSPVADEGEARSILETLRREFPDATHHCWALRLRSRTDNRELLDDDGEPSGTGGAPILQALRSARLSDSLMVVVRYFGGVKLGKGGLARAYRDAARLGIEASGVLERRERVRMRLLGPLTIDGEVRHLVAGHDGDIIDSEYDGGGIARLTVELPLGALEAFRSGLARLSRGAWTVVEKP